MVTRALFCVICVMLVLAMLWATLKFACAELCRFASTVPALPRLPHWISNMTRRNLVMSMPALVALVLLTDWVLVTSASERPCVSCSRAEGMVKLLGWGCLRLAFARAWQGHAAPAHRRRTLNVNLQV